MLVLSRYQGESIRIGNDIVVTVLEQRGRKTKLGIEAPSNVSINRTEVTRRPDFRNNGRTQKEPAAATPPAVTSNANPTNGQ